MLRCDSVYHLTEKDIGIVPFAIKNDDMLSDLYN